MEPIELCAWHESGRIFYAYRNGYVCDGAELSELDPGGGKAKLNGGDDTPVIQAILSGKMQPLTMVNQEKAIDVAKKLVKIYCAGSCVRAYHEARGRMDGQPEITIPGQDLKLIELLQQFMMKNATDHDEDYVSSVLSGIFRELRSEEVMKPIRSLAEKWLQSPDHTISRFNIEDAMMVGGFKPQKPKSANTFGFSLSEDHIPGPKSVNVSESPEEPPLDKALRNFLNLVRKEWSEEEMQASITFLKDVFRKLGNT